MTGPDHAGASKAGFTLLEVLVALAVLGLLIVGLNQSARTGLELWRVQLRQIGPNAEVESAARILRTLLSTLPISPDVASDPAAPPAPISFDGTAGRLTFVGDLTNGMGTNRRADITLLLREGRLVLRWTPHQHRSGGARAATVETELIRNVTGVELAYWDGSAADGQTGWVAHWDGPILPDLIRIRVQFSERASRYWPDLLIAPLLSAPRI